MQYRFAHESGGYATPGLDDVAFKNPDGSKVLLAYNEFATAHPLCRRVEGAFLLGTR